MNHYDRSSAVCIGKSAGSYLTYLFLITGMQICNDYYNLPTKINKMEKNIQIPYKYM